MPVAQNQRRSIARFQLRDAILDFVARFASQSQFLGVGLVAGQDRCDRVVIERQPVDPTTTQAIDTIMGCDRQNP